jgi:hypothetical protein
MPLHAVKTLETNVVVPGYGPVPNAQTTVNITQDAFNSIPSTMFSGSHLQDMGAVPDGSDAVVVQAPFVAVPAAVTSVQEATANATDLASAQALANSLKIKYNAAQADIAALRGTVAALQAALAGVGKPMAAS